MRPRLLTIPISHYCEKARWALDRARIAYVEEPHIQVVHMWKARRAGAGQTVPVLITDDVVLGDSPDILAWADERLPQDERLYPPEVAAEARRIEAWLGAGFGVDGRLWMYHSTLPVLKEMRPWALAGVPAWERRGFPVFGPAVDSAIRRHLKIDDDAAAAAIVNVRAVFDEIGALLADGRPFLTGERFTAADLTFGALSAPALVPAAYGSPLPQPSDLPPAMAQEILRLREHPAGVFAARLYRDERRP